MWGKLGACAWNVGHEAEIFFRRPLQSLASCPFYLGSVAFLPLFFTYSPPLYLVQEKVPIIEAKSSFSFFFCFFFLPFSFLFPFVTGNVSAKAWSKQNLVAIMISKHHDGQRHFLLSFFLLFFFLRNKPGNTYIYKCKKINNSIKSIQEKH